MNLPEAIQTAHQRIQPYVRPTPLDYSLAFSQMTGAEVWFKLENLQHTGSFKVRGAMNKLLSLSPAQLKAGIVTASSGNHGAGVAFGLAKLGAKGLVFVPEGASETKLRAIRRYGAEVRTHGTSGDDTELFARAYAAQNRMVYISPYNDPAVIAGQGTLGLEIAQQLDPPNPIPSRVAQTPLLGSLPAPLRTGGEGGVVFITVGGGGMISGVAAYLKSVYPNIKIVGCQPENDATMLACIKAGKIVQIEARPTLSDGSAGGLEAGSITFELCQTLVDDWVTVSEDEIKSAMKLFMQNQYQLLEGAAGVAIAAMLKTARQHPGQTLVAMVCGAKIGLEQLREVLV